MIVRVVLLGLSIVMSPFAVAAQEALTAPPPVLELQSEFLKPGKAGVLHERTEAAIAAAAAHARLQGHYVALNSMSGKSRTLFLTGYTSLATWQADNDRIAASPALATEFTQATGADGELLEAFEQATATYDAELSYKPNADLGHTRYVEITTFRIKPGHRKDWHDLVQMLKDANQKGATSAHWAMYRALYGVDNRTYFALAAHPSLAGIDQGIAEQPKFLEGLGDADAQEKLDKLYGEAVAWSRTELYAVNAAQSYPMDAWAREDSAFWRPRPEPAAVPAKISAKTPAKPAPVHKRAGR